MGPMRRQDFVHWLMVKVNRVSIAAILALVAIYSLVTYRGTMPNSTQGSGTSGAASLTTTSITGCGGGSGGSNDNWPIPVRGPR